MSAEPLEIHLDDQDLARALRDDVRAGLAGTPKSLPPKYFYDARGSELFEEITRLPEYYPTRAERAILARYAPDVARVTGADVLVELGSGSSEKTRLLLDALSQHGTLRAFVPLDVSSSALSASTAAIAAAYPGITVRGVVGDFTRHLKWLPVGGRRLVAFLGGTIGNLVPTDRAAFLGALREALEPGEWFLLGTDLVKDESVLVPAYDDAAGVTAEFNRNVLRVVNRELGADFDVDAFDHVALWNANEEWIEMRLRSRRSMTVRVLGRTYDFKPGEDLLTEVSAKFRREGVESELREAAFEPLHWWSDGAFAISLSRLSHHPR